MVLKDKAKDMKRAPLPSRADKMARTKKRRARKDSRRHGKRVAQVAMEHGWDEAVNLDPNWDNQHGPGWERATRDVVRERRGADNLGALMRWAESIKKDNPHLSAKELKAKVREVIGHSYMADHAMTHVEQIDGFDENPTRYAWRRTFDSGGYEKTLRERRDKLIAHIEDLWLRGHNDKIRAMARTSPKPIDGWEPVLVRTYEPVLDEDGNTRLNVFGRPLLTDNYTESISHYVRHVADFTDIPAAVAEWQGHGKTSYWFHHGDGIASLVKDLDL